MTQKMRPAVTKDTNPKCGHEMGFPMTEVAIPKANSQHQAAYPPHVMVVGRARTTLFIKAVQDDFIFLPSFGSHAFFQAPRKVVLFPSLLRSSGYRAEYYYRVPDSHR